MKPKRPVRYVNKPVDEEDRLNRIRQLNEHTGSIFDYIKKVNSTQPSEKQKSIIEKLTKEGRPQTVRNRRKIGSYELNSVDERELLLKKEHLLRYAWKGKTAKLERLYADPYYGKEINRTDSCGRTALHYAAAFGDCKMIELLVLFQDLDFNLRDDEGKTPLFKAVELGSAECVKLLLDHQANPCIAASDGRTPFEYSLQMKGDAHLDIIKLFIGVRHLDEYYFDNEVVSPLHILGIADVPVAETAKYLLQEENVDPNAQDTNGITPLMMAANNKNLALVDELVHYKTIPTLTDKEEREALDYCRDEDCYNLIESAKIDYETVEDMRAEFGSLFIATYFRT